MGSHPDHTYYEDLFNQAVKTRNEWDIRKFVVDTHLSWKNDSQVHAVSARQLQEDWDIKPSTFSWWVWSREQALDQAYGQGEAVVRARQCLERARLALEKNSSERKAGD